MARLEYNVAGMKEYVAGAKNAVLFNMDDDGKYKVGVAWEGLTGVNETKGGAEPSPIYANDVKYMDLMSAETYGATITAYIYPDEFEECQGNVEVTKGAKIGQQEHKPFGFAFMNVKGNDIKKNEYGNILTCVYNATAKPSSVDHKTIGENTEAGEFSWDVTSTPVEVPGYKPSATFVIDSTKIGEEKFKKAMDKIYGTDSTEPTLPSIAEWIELLKDTPVVGDGE